MFCFTPEVPLNFTLSDPNVLAALSDIPVIITLVVIPSSFTLFSMTTTLTIQPDLGSDTNRTCALVWLGKGGNPVLASNQVYRYIGAS